MLLCIVGILVTAKQRQEFRMKLQKRARRRAERKIEMLQDDKHMKEVSASLAHTGTRPHDALQDANVDACAGRSLRTNILRELFHGRKNRGPNILSTKNLKG